jgi:hypothetical protein
MNEHFRIRESYRNIAIAGLLLSVGMLAVSVYGAVKEDNASLWVVAVGWGPFVGLAVWILLAYWRESLQLDERTLVQHGIRRVRLVDWCDLLELQWRPGTIVLRSASEKITVHLDNFQPEQQIRLIRLLRRCVAVSIQRDWDLFCYEVAVPLLERAVDRPLGEDEVLRTRWHYDRLFLPFIVFVAAMGVMLAGFLQEVRWLFAAVPFAGLWLLLRTSIPPEGRAVKRSLPNRRPLVELAVMSTAVIVVAYVFSAFSHRLPYPYLWACLGTLLWLAIVLVWTYRLEYRERTGQRERIAIAVEQWQQQTGE